jgi:hypothetical protein
MNFFRIKAAYNYSVSGIGLDAFSSGNEGLSEAERHGDEKLYRFGIVTNKFARDTLLVRFAGQTGYSLVSL